MNNIYLQNASAGSGKTHTLANDVMDKVVKGIEPEQLVVTTFTKKAAAELRERLRRRLIEGGKIDEAHRVKDGHIGTVNSVSARIMKEYAIDSGASPALDVLPEEDEDRIFGIAIADAISAHATELEDIAERCGRTEEYAMFGEPRNWQNDVKDIVTAARSNRMSSDDVRRCAEKSWAGAKVLFAEAENGANDTAALLAAMETAAADLEGRDLTVKAAKDNQKRLKRLIKRVQVKGEITWPDWVGLCNADVSARESKVLMAASQAIARRAILQAQLFEDIKDIIYGVFNCAADAIDQYVVYKQEHGLMDFADQDAGVLELLEGNAEVGRMFSERIQEVFVDEFQDTNPIQLALFIELSKLSNRSLWVGDPKQAIYGFRGTDSKLMEAATRVIPKNNILTPLTDSYRSKERLIQFTNEVFAQTFHEMDSEDVRLNVPKGYEEKAKGGWVETWNILGTTPEYDRGIAGAVTDLLDRKDSKYKLGQIAVLCRSNKACELVAKNLENMGIRAAAEQGDIMNTPECQLAVAALRYMNTDFDTLALTEIVSLSPFHKSHKNWLAEIMERSANEETRETRFDEWKNDALIMGVSGERDNVTGFDLMQALEMAIEKVGLVETIAIWTKPEQRFGNLDRLRAACAEYVEYSRVQRSAATIAGFIGHLKETETKQAQGVGEDAVQVLSYHKAKGLQWPVVVLADVGYALRYDAFGINVEAESDFDAVQPLKDRFIRYWPWPFGGANNVEGLDQPKEATPEYKSAKEEAEAEARRLMYVGMTRAEDGIVIAVKSRFGKMETAWLDVLTNKAGAPVLRLPADPGEHALEIGDAVIPILTKQYDPGSFADDAGWRHRDTFVAPLASNKEHPAAKLVASARIDAALVKRAKIAHKYDMKTKLVVTDRFDAQILGDAVHAFLGVDTGSKSIDEKLALAERLVTNWGIDKNIKFDALVAVGEELSQFVGSRFPGAEVAREWPVTYRNGDGQLMQGPIDFLAETPDGFVIVDHKTYSGTNPEKKALSYAPQLATYKEAVEAATGKPVIGTFIHMPVKGLVFEVTFA